MNKLTNYYYTYHFGYYSYNTDQYYKITNNTIEYLADNNISEKEICQIIKDTSPSKALAIKNLPDSLWDNSLLTRDTFYYHKELHIASKAPKLNLNTDKMKQSKFYLEMRIMYSLNDLMNYYYSKVKNFEELRDTKRDMAALEYLLKRYDRISIVEPIDFILSLIDAARNSNLTLSNILDLQQFENSTYNDLEKKTTIANAKGYNKIIWRV